MRWFLQLLRCQSLTGLVGPELRSNVWELTGGRGVGVVLDLGM